LLGVEADRHFHRPARTLDRADLAQDPRFRNGSRSTAKPALCFIRIPTTPSASSRSPFFGSAIE